MVVVGVGVVGVGVVGVVVVVVGVGVMLLWSVIHSFSGSGRLFLRQVEPSR